MASKGDAPRFFVLERGGFGSSHDTEMLETDPVNFGQAPRCHACGRFIGARRWLAPRRVDLTQHGVSWGDFAFRGAVGDDFLMSHQAADSYRAAAIRGLSGFEPVEIVRARGSTHPPPEYVHVDVEHGDSAIEPTRSELRHAERIQCSRCLYGGTLDAVHGFEIAPDTWTGSDVFVPLGLPGTVTVSARFRDWAEAERLTNVQFVATRAYAWDSTRPSKQAYAS